MYNTKNGIMYSEDAAECVIGFVHRLKPYRSFVEIIFPFFKVSIYSV